ncbi:MAG: AgmX/PglI C-terminal domain-containing protein, partial [Myxococcales bacterium]|nr:AgmX/PglI C-terminal domain-containing protein [Myxococcales bacterium]
TALALEVIVTFRGTVIDVRHLAPGEQFTVGADGADLETPHPALAPDTPHPLATFDPAGNARLDLCPGLAAAVLVDGRVDPVERPGGLRLLPGHKARVALDELGLLFALVPAAAPLPRARVELLDRGSRRGVAIAAALHAALLAIAFSFPVVAETLRMDRFETRAPVVFDASPVEDKPEDIFAITPRGETAGDASDGPSQIAVPRPRPDRETGGGDGGTVEDRKAIAKAAADELRTALGDALGEVDPLGAEAHAALGQMFGGDDGRAEAFGGTLRPGFGGPGVAPGAGGGPSVGVAMRTRGRDTEPGYGRPEGKIPGRDTKVPTVVVREPAEVIGGLGRDDIARVVRRHRDAIRFCYEKALQTKRGLEGKVTMRFVVGGNGAVLAAKAAESTIGSAEVEQCLARQIQTWVFPAVQGGGVVVVRYPFLFRAG